VADHIPRSGRKLERARCIESFRTVAKALGGPLGLVADFTWPYQQAGNYRFVLSD
jgi:hypothetical protein